jgi:hypothetical protein
MPAYGGRRTREGHPRAWLTPAEGGTHPRARRNPPEGERALERGGTRSREVLPLERGEARPRGARVLERGGAYSRGSLRGQPWWAVGVPAAWAVSCMVRHLHG